MMEATEILSKKLLMRGAAFAQVRASGVSDGDNFRFTSRGAVATAAGDGEAPPTPVYQDTPVIVCVISG